MDVETWWRRARGLRTAGTPISAGGSRGLVLHGQVWCGGDTEPFPGAVILDGTGRVLALGPEVPPDAERRGMVVIGSPRHWVLPGVYDAHVHLCMIDPAQPIGGGVVGVRDLGGPRESLHRMTALARRRGIGLQQSGPILTSVGGYPVHSWGHGGVAIEVESAHVGAALVAEWSRAGAQVIKIALEPGPGYRTLRPEAVTSIVRAAHQHGMPVVAHAMSAEMIDRALVAGVDELAHVPVQPLDELAIERIAAAGVPVCSTLQHTFSSGSGATAMRNARALVRAGVRLVYGTDAGHHAVRGVDPRELERLAEAGLGRWGALRVATTPLDGSAPDRPPIRVGSRSPVVVLPESPMTEPAVWQRPVAVITGGRIRTS